MDEKPLTLRRKLFLSSLIVLIFLAVGLCLEGILRVVAPQLGDSLFSTGVRLPNQQGYTGGHVMKLNRFRMREIDFAIEDPPGKKRIFTTGDSITAGYGLAAEDAWPKALQHLLQERPEGRDYFVINGGGTGATTHRQLQFYEQFGRKLGAKVIIVGFCMNDVAPRGVLSDVGFATEGKVAKSFEWRSELRRSYLFAALDLTMTEAFKRYIYPVTSGRSWLYAYPYQINAFGVTEGSESAWEATLDSIAKLGRAVRNDGNVLIIAAFPYQFQVSDDRRDNPYKIDKTKFTVDPFQRLRDVTGREGILFVDLQRTFQDERRPMLDGKAPWDPLFIDFCHPNPRGQMLAARRILQVIEENALLDRS